MAAAQRLVLTALPNGVTPDGAALRVSVLLSPRLTGAARLSDFPDFLTWPRRLRDDGLGIGLLIGSEAVTVTAATDALRPDLWEAVFAPDTRVDPYVFDDYSDRLVVSYPHQAALAAVKALFQVIGLQSRDPDAITLRGVLGHLAGFHFTWDAADAAAERERAFGEQHRFDGLGPVEPPFRPGADGLPTFTSMPDTDAIRSVARRFWLYHHMPVPDTVTRPPMDKVLDFHRALTALTAYPSLLRALGLVFDLTVPRAGLHPGFEGELRVTAFDRGGPWEPDPQWVMPSTAYRLVPAEPDIFTAASLSGLELGLLPLGSPGFGLAQVDADSALHKVIMFADSIRTTDPAPHPEVLDTTALTPALRSGGLAVVAAGRAGRLAADLDEARAFNEAVENGGSFSRPLYLDDVLRGVRLDIWDAERGRWYSLHRRNGTYRFREDEGLVHRTEDEEGFTQLAVTRPAAGAEGEGADDLYLSEVLARWNGWSLSAPRPGRNLSRHPDPDHFLPVDDPSHRDHDPENAAVTPFPLRAEFQAVPRSLPRLRFGGRYRVRARAVDLAGNSVDLDDPQVAAAGWMAGPGAAEGFAYLRYEPVGPPELVLRDPAGVTGPGSAVERLVIRSYNNAPSLDGVAPDRAASDRHLAPPRASAELAERHGLFDDPVTGRLRPDAALHELIAARDEGQWPTVSVPIAGDQKDLPLDPRARLDTVPYLPDPLARGVTLRDLPGAPEASVGGVEPAGPSGLLRYRTLPDARPRPGSATVIGFDAGGDWRAVRPFRLALTEGEQPPYWSAADRMLLVQLPKATLVTVPVSSSVGTDDLKLLGVWQWLREAVDARGRELDSGTAFTAEADQLVRLLHETAESGHWMLTPPRLVTLVHAVQQPLGRPEFITPDPRPAGHQDMLETLDRSGPTAGEAFETLSAWREEGSPDAYLIGGLRVHGPSTGAVELLAEWTDPVDDPARREPGERRQAAPADEFRLPRSTGRLDTVSGDTVRTVGYYEHDHGVVWFARQGDQLGDLAPDGGAPETAAPLHRIGDTLHHVVRYRARTTSRFTEYFPADQGLDFTRTSEEAVVHVPASARPAPPRIVKVLPTFGWDRQTSTNLKSSVRLGRGLRVYLERPWFSSGTGELLGVVLWQAGSGEEPDAGPTDHERHRWRRLISQWGVDPVWETEAVPPVPTATADDFPDAVAFETGLPLEETVLEGGRPVRAYADVAGHEVRFDADQGLWYCDLTLGVTAYTPFVRLAVARYQPHALDTAKLSQVALADYAQLAPDRAVVVTADPFRPRELRVTVSGVAPQAPVGTLVTVTVQRRDPSVGGDLGWTDVSAPAVTVRPDEQPPPAHTTRWSGTVSFREQPGEGDFRLLIREYEFLRPGPGVLTGVQLARDEGPPLAGRVVYADTVTVDASLIAEPPAAAAVTGTGEVAQPPEPPAGWTGTAPPAGGTTAPAEPAGPTGGTTAPAGTTGERTRGTTGERTGGTTAPAEPAVPAEGPEAPAWAPVPDPPRTDGIDWAGLPTPGPSVNPSDVDGHVKLAQACLNSAVPGANLAVDGNLGPLTVAALAAFRTSAGLPQATGIDTATWLALALAAPLPLLEPGPRTPPMTGPPVALVQGMLNRAGAFPLLDVDGAHGPLTAAALRDFQTEQGLAPTGTTAPDTWAALATAPDATAPSRTTMRLTFSYDSADWAEDGPLVRLLRREDLELTAPPSDPLTGPMTGLSGFWYELQDAHGQVLHRRRLHRPIRVTVEVPPEAPATGAAAGEDGGGGPSTHPVDRPSGTFELLAPVLYRARTLVLYSSPLDPARQYEAAAAIGSFAVEPPVADPPGSAEGGPP